MAGVRDSSFLQNVQTGCGAQPTSCSVGIGHSFLGVKLLWREVDHVPALVLRSRMSAATDLHPPLPQYAFMIWTGTSLRFFTFVSCEDYVMSVRDESVQIIGGMIPKGENWCTWGKTCPSAIVQPKFHMDLTGIELRPQR